MGPEKRRRRIVELVTRHGGLTVTELSDRVEVSESTIRRDLNDLADRDLIERTHGGAVPVSNVGSEPSFRQKVVQGKDRKRAIGARAAGEIRGGQVVFFDSGTTTLQAAREAPNDGSFVSVTNSPLLAMELGKDKGIVEVTGGTFRGETLALIGPQAEKYIRLSNFDLAFIGANGLDEAGALTVPVEAEANVKREVIANAARVHVVAEVEKFGERAFREFATLEDVDAVVTGREIPDRFVDCFESADTEWFVGEGE